MKEISALREELKRYIDSADERTIKMIQAMLEADQESDWWEDLSESARTSIQQGLKDADAGKVTPHEAVMKEYKKWL